MRSALAALAITLTGAAAPSTAQPPHPVLLRPAAVFDGEALHPGWSVLVTGDRIAAAGPAITAPAGTETIELPGDTLLPRTDRRARPPVPPSVQ